ncbi:MAG: YcjF family protein [Synechococcales cyanobacterium RM1_1_8]|nr:YcjF family protein [Synechococcales cyanobacterium RM1_1_8]
MVAEPPQQLVWATLCHRANGLATAAKALLNQLRRQRASKAIEQYQWVAAGAAFINPVPTLDLLATAAVNSQLILDLSKIYRQPLSPDHAKTMATTLAEMLIKLGLVEVSSKLLGIALKSNGVTYLAGGLIQGASAAYLTRTVGQSLVEYFELLEVTGELPEVKALEQLQQVVQQTFQASRQSPMLQGFAKQALNRLRGETVKEMASGTASGAVGETASASS